jgi:hypothetical protein
MAIACAVVAPVGLVGCSGSVEKKVPPPPPGISNTAVPLPPKPVNDFAEYMPMRAGDTWELTVDANGAVETYTNRAVGENAEEKAFFYELSTGGSTVLKEGYRVTPEGILRVKGGAAGDEPVEPPLPVLVPPFETGQTWKWEGAVISQAGTVFTTCRAEFKVGPDEKVQVGSETLTARRVDQVFTFKTDTGEQSITESQWFAKGVGVVQQIDKDGDKVTTAKLVKYTPVVGQPIGGTAIEITPQGAGPTSGGAPTSGGSEPSSAGKGASGVTTPPSSGTGAPKAPTQSKLKPTKAKPAFPAFGGG